MKFLVLLVFLLPVKSLLANDCLQNYKLRLEYREKTYSKSKIPREQDKYELAYDQYNDLNAVLSNNLKYLVPRLDWICERNYGGGNADMERRNLSEHCGDPLKEAQRSKRSRGGKDLFTWIKEKYSKMEYCKPKSRMPSISKKYKKYVYDFNLYQEYLDHYRAD